MSRLGIRRKWATANWGVREVAVVSGALTKWHKPQSGACTRAQDDVECDSMWTGAKRPSDSSRASAHEAAPGAASCNAATIARMARDLNGC